MNVSKAQAGTVYLVGAGPGDPELLTVRALRLLQTADLVLHDDLVPREVLEFAGPTAEVVSVGKRCGQRRITQAGIHQSMIEAARAGQAVVRLKSGDPLIFGRAGEEISALVEADVPFQIVPGITAALAAGAALRMPLTDRERASKLILLTGHHAAGKDAAEPVWVGPLPSDVSVVVYMPGRDLRRLTTDLRAAGMGSGTPCVAISEVATPRQNHTFCRLGGLGEAEVGPAPLLILAGPAVETLVHAHPEVVEDLALLAAV